MNNYWLYIGHEEKNDNQAFYPVFDHVIENIPVYYIHILTGFLSTKKKKMVNNFETLQQQQQQNNGKKIINLPWTDTTFIWIMYK